MSSPTVPEDSIALDFLAKAKRTRKLHTPTIRCVAVLRALEEQMPEILPEAQPGAFERTVLRPFMDGLLGDCSGDALASRIWQEWGGEGSVAGGAFFVAAAYAVEAIKADQAKDAARAWDLAFDAAQWEGFLSGILTSGDDTKAEEALEKIVPRPWALHKPMRDDVMAGVLFRTLKPAFDAGEPRPKARDIFSEWIAEKPPEFIYINPAELSYVSSKDQEKVETFDNFKSRLKRMTDINKGRKGGSKVFAGR